MHGYQIKTHRLNAEYTKPHFFILNKGLNSGKPLRTPCPNCFVCLVDPAQESEQLFWVAFALWKSNILHRLLKGSVIPFITIGDYKNQLKNHFSKAKAQNGRFVKFIKNLQILEQQEQNYKRTLGLIQSARIAYFHQFFTP